MNYRKKQILRQFKYNPQWWRNKLIMAFIIAIGFINLGCEKEDSENINENNDDYYVKYIVKSNSIYIVSSTAQIISENNEISSFTFKNSPWEVTIGPVKKGFSASLSAEYDTSPDLARTYIDAEIHISKNDEPFALKASDNSTEVRYSASTSYTIN